MSNDFSIELVLSSREVFSAVLATISATVCIVLASLSVMAVWFYGSVFRPLRAWVNASDHWFCRLLSCPFCLTFHVTVVMLLVWNVGLCGRAVVQWLAVVAVVHWLWFRFWSYLFDRAREVGR